MTLDTTTTMAGDLGQPAVQSLQPPSRAYAVTYLRRSGDIAQIQQEAPAIPAFEDAFGVLARGTILQSPKGPVAVEDLLPGDHIRCADGHFATLLWRGMITLAPDGRPAPVALTWIRADALGLAQPLQDLVLGPAARLYRRTRGITKLTGYAAAYLPARDFIDSDQFIAIRPTAAVDLYQLGFARQETVLANGIGIESLHTGSAFGLGLRGEGLAQYLRLFPHLRSLEDMGLPKFPRLRLSDLDLSD